MSQFRTLAAALACAYVASPAIAAPPDTKPAENKPAETRVVGCHQEVRKVAPPIPEGRAIKVGVLLPERQMIATSMRNGATMAVDDLNTQGGVLGHRVEVKYYDEGDSDEAGIAAVKRAIADGSDVITGGASATAGAAYVDAATAANRFIFLTTIGPLDANQKWTTQWSRYKTYFQMDPLGPFLKAPAKKASVKRALRASEWPATMAYMRHLWGFDRIALVGAKGPGPRIPLGAIKGGMEERGLKVTGIEEVTKDTTEAQYEELWKRLVASKTQVVWYVFDGDIDAVPFFKTYGKLKPPILPYGIGVTVSTKEFWKATNGGCAYAIVDVKGVADIPIHTESNAWMRRYWERFKDYPTMLGDDVYAAIIGYADAVDRTKTLDQDILAATIEQMHLPAGPGYFSWLGMEIGSCHLRERFFMGGAPWDAQWHPSGELVSVFSHAAFMRDEDADFSHTEGSFARPNMLRLPPGLKPVKPPAKQPPQKR